MGLLRYKRRFLECFCSVVLVPTGSRYGQARMSPCYPIVMLRAMDITVRPCALRLQVRSRWQPSTVMVIPPECPFLSALLDVFYVYVSGLRFYEAVSCRQDSVRHACCASYESSTIYLKFGRAGMCPQCHRTDVAIRDTRKEVVRIARSDSEGRGGSEVHLTPRAQANTYVSLINRTEGQSNWGGALRPVSRYMSLHILRPS